MTFTCEDMFEQMGFNDFFNKNDRSCDFVGMEQKAYKDGWETAKQFSDDM